VTLSLTTRHEGDYTIIECVGELDIVTVPDLRELLAELIADGHYHLVVDLQGLDFIDSTGLGVLVGGHKRVHPHDGSLQLVRTKERILELFRITGLANIFPIHAATKDALGHDD
jgi:anti-sigma B factor antagonist